ncbi:MAG: DUF4320 family protein, partial [Clostridiales bacterium]|nr:DUF4320 family protein [Clostridiales bacterium]
SEAGSFFIDTAIALAILLAVIFSFLAIPELFIRKQEIDYIARMVVRRIEQSGQIGDELFGFIADIKDETGIDPDIAWDGNFRGHGDKIQIREKFTVTVEYSVRVKIVEPSFAGPLYIELPLSKTLSGVSEVYWKELA